MNGLNVSVFDGYMPRDPVPFEMKNGRKGVVFNLIWSRDYGNIHELCDLSVACYQEGRAEAVIKYCKKGSRVQVEGYLVSMPKKSKSGDEYKETQLKADKIYFISSKEDNSGKSETKKPAAKKTAKKTPTDGSATADDVQYFDPETGEIRG
jgi:single-stranded DNA-binding protein